MCIDCKKHTVSGNEASLRTNQVKCRYLVLEKNHKEEAKFETLRRR